MTLWDKFLNSTQPISVVWKIFDRHRRLLCADYGSLKNEDVTLDDLEVYKAEVKFDKNNVKYVRCVVNAD